MPAKTLKTVPKISVKIWTPILEKLDSKLEKACLRRDAYLSKVLTVELDHLDAEVSIPNSQASYDYIASRLKQLDSKLVSLAISPEAAARVNDICDRKKIVRDAFFNRLFLMLAASPKFIDALLFPDFDGNWRSEVWTEFKHDGPFIQNGFDPLEAPIDPFCAIRWGIDLMNESEKFEDYVDTASGKTFKVVPASIRPAVEPCPSFYTIEFDQKFDNHDLAGLNCYLPDRSIPGTDAELAYRAKLDDILEAFL